MPTEKRERKRAGKQARRAAAEAARRRAARRRQIATLAGLLAAILLIGFLVSRGGDDGTDVAAGDDPSASTTVPGDPPVTAEPSALTPQLDPATLEPVPPECPPEGGADRVQRVFTEAPPTCLEEGVDYAAVIETDIGEVTVDLYEDEAPNTVNNFVFLARWNAYRDIPFHRVIPGFVVQGGDVQGQGGTGGPGYQFADELPEAGDYQVGSVAMANSGPNTNGSQFFIVTGQQGAELPPQYALFGEVTEGMDLVLQIEGDGSPSGTPTTVHTIENIRIVEK